MRGCGPIGPEGAAPGREPHEVLGEHRALADRVDAGLRQRSGIERGDVPGREHARIARGLERLPHPDEPRVVEVEPALAEPVGRPRMGDRDREVAADRGPLSARRHRVDPVRAYRDHPVAGEKPHPALTEEAGHPAPDGRGVRLDDLARLREEGDLDPVRHPGPLEEGAKAVPEGERQLRPPGSPPDHRDPEPPTALQAVALDRRPPFPEDVDRLDPEGVVPRPLDVVQGRLRADVDGEEVEADGGPAGREDPPRAQVDPRRRGVQDPGVREPRELPEIDVRLLRRVVAGDEAGEHPRVGGEQVARDEGEAHPGDRVHSEALEHRHVAVAAPDQHDVGRDGRGPAGVHVRTKLILLDRPRGFRGGARATAAETARMEHPEPSCPTLAGLAVAPIRTTRSFAASPPVASGSSAIAGSAAWPGGRDRGSLTPRATGYPLRAPPPAA